MPAISPDDQVPIQAPLCKKHFKKYARRQIELEVEADSAVKPEKNIEEPRQPTRIQPRRVAKDRYLRTKIKTKKRNADEAFNGSKRRKTQTEDDFEVDVPWTSFEISLDQMETRTVKQAKRRMSHNCPFGPVPWVCSLCVDEINKSSKEVSSPRSTPIAPVADMALVGEQLKLHSRGISNKGIRSKFRCGDMDCTIDACGETMFMFL
ncbi:hypothetical protein LCI18_001920 [Fusarium solani-melongenae]|uniref:Uncharacterized protein n=1 Tax=Fusarium solani subsp. cucurbitae TaxID=2747967 RepID=A0ACD3YQ18_FUSSC|nr:hypothetical protein LCI18_001920 [Fusarium solani-melongenae]